MADTYCVFLRGVNIGNIRIRMDDLRQAFVDMGFLHVQTKLSTGNVIVTAPRDGQSRDAWKAMIEHGLSERFGYEAYVFLRDAEDIAEICAAASLMTVPSDCHQYILLCDDKELIIELTQRFESIKHEKEEQWMPHTQGAFWIIPKGMTLESEFGYRVLGDPRFKSRLTSRNMNTLFKIHHLLHQ